MPRFIRYTGRTSMCVAVVESHSFEASSLFAWIMLVGGQGKAYIGRISLLGGWNGLNCTLFY